MFIRQFHNNVAPSLISLVMQLNSSVKGRVHNHGMLIFFLNTLTNPLQVSIYVKNGPDQVLIVLIVLRLFIIWHYKLPLWCYK